MISTASITISLTQFVNFVTKQPEKQLTVVRQIRKQHDEGYDVPPDLYKQFRDAVVSMHKRNHSKSVLDACAANQTEPARMQHYPLLVSGYKKFVGNKRITWWTPFHGLWQYSELHVKVRPELGLCWEDKKYLVKLHLNQEEDMNKRRAEIVCHLMRLAVLETYQDVIPAVLDVRKGKLFEIGKSDHEQTVLLRAQARAFVEYYRGLGTST